MSPTPSTADAYLREIRALAAALGEAHPRLDEVYVCQQRLSENLNRAATYGDTEALRAERAEIWARCNRISREVRGEPLSVPEALPSPAAANPNRERMFQLVHNTWIEGVLEQSLHGAAMLELGMAYDHDAVEHPWEMVVQMPGRERAPVPPGTAILDLFDQMDGALLILGEPGAGKTTTLLELTRAAIARARRDPAHPIPVVFNLATWAERRQPLDAWLVEELNARYHIPRRIARPWVAEDRLMVLLDGLDEVRADAREGCVAAINAFRREHGVAPVAVCSRTAAYEALAQRLQLRGAVVLQPLTLAQMDAYLALAGEGMAPVRELLHEDDDLRDLARTPLMLSVMVLAYHGERLDDVAALDSVDAWRAHLFDYYIRRMFRRRGGAHPFPPSALLGWLRWLARQMARHNQTVFYLEDLQPSWLANARQRWAYVLATRVLGTVLMLLMLLVMEWMNAVSVVLVGLGIGAVDGLRLNEARESERGLGVGQAVAYFGLLLALSWIGLTLFGAGPWSATGWAVTLTLLFGLRGMVRRWRSDVRLAETLRWSWWRFLLPLAIALLASGLHLAGSAGYRAATSDRWLMPGSSAITGVWTADGRRLGALEPGPRYVGNHRFSSDGDRIVGHGFGVAAGAGLWDAEGRLLAVLRPEEEISAAAFFAQGARVVAAGDEGAWLWDAQGRLITALPGVRGKVRALIVGPHDRYVAARGPQGAWLWDAEGQLLWEVSGRVSALAFDPAGDRLAAMGEGQGWLWEIASRTEVALRGIRRDVGPLGAPPGPEDAELPTATVPTATLGSAFPNLAFAPDGERVAAWGKQGAGLWDTEGRLVAGLAAPGQYARDLAFGPQGRYLAVQGEEDAWLWDTDGHLLGTLAGQGHEIWYLTRPRALKFSPQGDTVAVQGRAGWRLWSCEDPPHPVALPGAEGELTALTFAPAGRLAACSETACGIWRTPQADPVPLPGAAGRISALTFGPDGRRLLTWSDAGAWLWDGEGRRRLTLAEDGGHVEDLAFSPDGRRLVMVARAARQPWWRLGNVWLEVVSWDPVDGVPVGEEAGLAFEAGDVAFSPDGLRFALDVVPPRDYRELAPLWMLPGLALALLMGAQVQTVEVRQVPEQGVSRSIRNAMVIGIVGLMGGVVLLMLMAVAAVRVTRGTWMYDIYSDIVLGMSWWQLGVLALTIVGAFDFLPVLLMMGWLDTLQYTVLRVMLWAMGRLPWRAVRFLDYCVDRIFLRRAGGGYLFIHRLLREHVAALSPDDIARLTRDAPGGDAVR